VRAEDGRLRRARGLYDAGAFAKAEAILIGLTEERPRDLEPLLLLGSIAGRTGRNTAAEQWFTRARDIDSLCVESWKGLGLVYRQQRRLDDAVSAYEQALTLDRDDAETHTNLGVALKLRNEVDRAIGHLEMAIRLQPHLSAAYMSLGNCYFERGDVERAGAAYLECLRIDRSAGAAIGLAKVLREQRRFELAERTLRTAASQDPDNAEIAATLGALLHDLGRDPEALAALDSALTTDPRNVAALFYWGNIKRDLGCWDEAEGFYRRALAITPDHPDAVVNLADTAAEQGRLSEALRLLEAVRQAHGSDLDVRYACGIVALSHGALAVGWPDIASYVKTAKRKPLRFPHLPRLDSLVLTGRRLALWGDQGIGDEILYGSFLQDLRPHAAQIVCEIDRRLVPLFSRGFPELEFVGRAFEPSLPAEDLRRAWRSAPLDTRLAGATHQASLPDLGGWLRPDLSCFPQHAGYLKADDDRVAEFHRTLKKHDGELLVGLSWRSHNQDIGRHKSVGLRQLVDSLPAQRLRFVSLQYGSIEDEVSAARAATLRAVDVVPDLDCFSDIDGLAALISACDAVVTVSNVTAHLAGSLGQRTALLCPLGAGKPWYWFSARDDSPWYPSMRIFRQSREGSWTRALADCATWLSQR
jgi:tetratricopeptide (TPR) repeat protein